MYQFTGKYNNINYTYDYYFDTKGLSHEQNMVKFNVRFDVIPIDEIVKNIWDELYDKYNNGMKYTSLSIHGLDGILVRN